MDADGGAPRRLTPEPSADFSGSWSRDGRGVSVFSHRSGRQEVWKVPASGDGPAIQITHGGGRRAEESRCHFLYYTTSRPVVTPGGPSGPAQRLGCRGLDLAVGAMHDSCMATKTISLEIDAYEKLKKAKRSERESFSEVVRRARFDDEPSTGPGILAHLSRLRTRHPSSLLPDEVLDRLDERVRSRSVRSDVIPNDDGHGAD